MLYHILPGVIYFLFAEFKGGFTRNVTRTRQQYRCFFVLLIGSYELFIQRLLAAFPSNRYDDYAVPVVHHRAHGGRSPGRVYASMNCNFTRMGGCRAVQTLAPASTTWLSYS